MTSTPRPLRVALLSDGIPGHFRQSEGVVAALARRHAIDLLRIALPAHNTPLLRLMAFVTRRAPGRLPLRLHLGIDDPGPLDVIVSAGGRTLAANVELAQRHPEAFTIFSGSPRAFGAAAFDRVLLSYPAPPENGLYVLKPTALDPDTLSPPRRAGTEEAPLRIGVLIGGSTAVCRFEDAEWDRLLSLVATLSETPGVSLLLVTSRRTPEDWNEDVLAMARGRPGIERVIDYRTAGTGSIADAFGTDALLVTADSMSMVTEGVAARRPVIMLQPAKVKPSRDTATMDDLEAQGRIARVSLTEEPKVDAVLAAFAARRPITENHLDRLADLLEPVSPRRAPAAAPPLWPAGHLPHKGGDRKDS